MKYALVSDIHANLQAWRAVWADIVAQGVDRVICLGDIVGYGPNPAETLAAVHSKVHDFLIGNHDEAVCEGFDDSIFTDDARRMIAWTKKQLGPNASAFFRQLPYTMEIDGGGTATVCVHSSMHEPDQYNYVETEEDARACWAACSQQLVFAGHTHVPQAYVLDEAGQVALLRPKDLTLEAGRRYIVNVGSVGIPRHGDFRAWYCIFDTEQQRVAWQHTAYDFEAFKRDVVTQIGESAQTQALLAAYETRDGPARDLVDFSATRKAVPEEPRKPKPSKIVINRDALPSPPAHEVVKRPAPRKKKKIGALVGAGLSATVVAALALYWVASVVGIGNVAEEAPPEEPSTAEPEPAPPESAAPAPEEPPAPKRTTIGSWSPGEVGATVQPVRFDFTGAIDSPGLWLLRFQYTKGRARLTIRDVRLLQNGKEVGRDTHHGVVYSGGASRNVYKLPVRSHKEGDRYAVIADIHGERDKHCWGNLTLEKADQ
jgi:predicted phosphodiesterase